MFYLAGGGGAGGGLFAEAGTPHGQAAKAGLGGAVDGYGGSAGNLFFFLIDRKINNRFCLRRCPAMTEIIGFVHYFEMKTSIGVLAIFGRGTEYIIISTRERHRIDNRGKIWNDDVTSYKAKQNVIITVH